VRAHVQRLQEWQRSGREREVGVEVKVEVEVEIEVFQSLVGGDTVTLYALYHSLVYLMNDNSTLLFTTT